MSEQHNLGSLHICCSLVRLVPLNDFKSELRRFSKSVIGIPKEEAKCCYLHDGLWWATRTLKTLVRIGEQRPNQKEEAGLLGCIYVVPWLSFQLQGSLYGAMHQWGLGAQHQVLFLLSFH